MFNPETEFTKIMDSVENKLMGLWAKYIGLATKERAEIQKELNSVRELFRYATSPSCAQAAAWRLYQVFNKQADNPPVTPLQIREYYTALEAAYAEPEDNEAKPNR